MKDMYASADRGRSRLYSGAIQLLLRLYSASIKALFSIYSGSIQALFRLASGALSRRDALQCDTMRQKLLTEVIVAGGNALYVEVHHSLALALHLAHLVPRAAFAGREEAELLERRRRRLEVRWQTVLYGDRAEGHARAAQASRLRHLCMRPLKLLVDEALSY